jgi:hypothetical protein
MIGKPDAYAGANTSNFSASEDPYENVFGGYWALTF